ncbi:hypothetical protein EVAR_59095_1 [Eumeta japonica]|uniref:Uncharacterized protein n=1 Tax=Eumeta variegata TaxID=151549 RepID=A0A4C1YYS6_EUMVA|nr:hypothetical protein EVAR_59095_1 [Eumeta japonica]
MHSLFEIHILTETGVSESFGAPFNHLLLHFPSPSDVLSPYMPHAGYALLISSGLRVSMDSGDHLFSCGSTSATDVLTAYWTMFGTCEESQVRDPVSAIKKFGCGRNGGRRADGPPDAAAPNNGPAHEIGSLIVRRRRPTADRSRRLHDDYAPFRPIGSLIQINTSL